MSRWDSEPQPQEASGRRPTPRLRGHWDRLIYIIRAVNIEGPAFLSTRCQLVGILRDDVSDGVTEFKEYHYRYYYQTLSRTR